MALTKNDGSAFSARYDARMHTCVRVSTAVQSFFICRTHTNYGTACRFFEREFIEPGLYVFPDVISAEKADLIDIR